MDPEEHATTPSSPVRIAYVIDRLYYPAGGTETQLLHLLRNIDRRRFSPELFCLQGTEWVTERLDSVPVTILDAHVSWRPGILRSVVHFSKLLREGSFDLVQTHFRDANIVGVLAATLARGPVVVSTRRGVPYWATPGGLLFLKSLNRRVDRFLANSHATAQRLAETEGVPWSRIDVIHNGLIPGQFTRDPDTARAHRAALGIPQDAPIVGIVANLRAVKGLEDFLQAAFRVHEERPDTHFAIVGSGRDEDRLRRLAADLGIASQAHLLGARDDVAELLSTFDVGVLASHFESFSNSILEYLAAGLPVVATDVGGTKEAVSDGENGFLVPPQRPDLMADRILTLLRHRGGARSWRRDPGLPERFLLSNVIKRHEDFYEALVSGRA